MNYKELLELAAKAAGIELLQGYGEPQWRCMFYQDSEGSCHDWNPLTDDGDALRLAVKLNIPIWECAKYNRAMAEVRYGAASGEYWEPVGDDPYAATRRAIVRAAVEIGKSL